METHGSSREAGATLLREINFESSSLAQRCQAACPCLVWVLSLVMGADQLCCRGRIAKCLMGVSIHLLQLPEVVQCRCCCAIRGDGFNLTVKNYNCFIFFYTETCINFKKQQKKPPLCKESSRNTLPACSAVVMSRMGFVGDSAQVSSSHCDSVRE